MARKKKQLMVLLITLGVAVLLLAGLLIWNWYSGKQQAAAEEAALVHVTTVEDPVQLTYCNGTDTLAFTKEGDDWKSKDTPDFPLDSTFLETIVTALADLTADRELDIVDELSAYGLEDAKSWITVTDEDGKEATLCLGNTTGESDYYAMLKGGDTIYTIPGDLVTDISYDLYGLAKLAEFPALSSSNTRQVTIQGKLKSTLTVEEAESGTDSEADSSEASSADSSAEGTDTKEYNWYLSGDVDVTKEAYLTALRTEIDSIAFSRLYDFQPSAKALKRCGLSDPAAALTVEYLDSEEERQTVTLLLGASYTDEAGTEYRYAMLRGSEDEVYLVTADSVRQTLAAAEHGYAQASADYNDEASESTQTTE